MPGDKTYYVPHNGAFHTDKIPSVDLANLTRRNHDNFIKQAMAVDEALATSSKAKSERLAKEYGIKGRSILSHLPSISFPDSFPEDFMHLVFENNIKNLISHWFSDFKAVTDSKEEYTLTEALIEAIGREGEQAGSTIPSAYGARLPDIAKSRKYVTADMWSFWTLSSAKSIKDYSAKLEHISPTAR
jgi:hypothetical protein